MAVAFIYLSFRGYKAFKQPKQIILFIWVITVYCFFLNIMSFLRDRPLFGHILVQSLLVFWHRHQDFPLPCFFLPACIWGPAFICSCWPCLRPLFKTWLLFEEIWYTVPIFKSIKHTHTNRQPNLHPVRAENRSDVGRNRVDASFLFL